MEVRHLKLVKSVAESGTLTKAAKKLFLSQSALSHQLKELETRVGGAVFHRVHKKMILTPIGERLLQTANQVLDALQIGETEIRQLIAGDKAFIRLSTQCYTFYHWFSKVLFHYREQYPKVDVRIIPEATYKALEWLEQGKLDIAVLNYKPDNSEIQVFELFEDELNVIVHSEHSLASKSHVNISNLKDIHYITYQLPKGSTSRTYKQVFEANGITPSQITKVQLTELILEMIKAGLGVSILARWAIEKHLEDQQLKALRLKKNGTKRKWYACTLKSRKIPEYILSFIESLRETAPSLKDPRSKT